MKKYYYYLPVLLVVFSNAVYDIAAKSIPTALNAMASLVITYLSAALCAFILFFVSDKEKKYFKEIKKVNKAIFLMAVGVVVIDLGYILLFREGWDISVGSLICNIVLAVSMVIIGITIYKEKLTKNHLVGIAFCLAGFILINLG